MKMIAKHRDWEIKIGYSPNHIPQVSSLQSLEAARILLTRLKEFSKVAVRIDRVG